MKNLNYPNIICHKNGTLQILPFRDVLTLVARTSIAGIDTSYWRALMEEEFNALKAFSLSGQVRFFRVPEMEAEILRTSGSEVDPLRSQWAMNFHEIPWDGEMTNHAGSRADAKLVFVAGNENVPSLSGDKDFLINGVITNSVVVYRPSTSDQISSDKKAFMRNLYAEIGRKIAVINK